MRVLSVFALAAVFAFVPFATGEDKKELKRPPLDAKEWKKQKSGLEIWDVKEGKGDAVKAGATVKIHYTGWLTDDERPSSTAAWTAARRPSSRWATSSRAGRRAFRA